MPRASYEKVERFYRALAAEKNEDGYAMCSVTYAGQFAGVAAATALLIPDDLEAMGCIKVYRTQIKPIESDKPGRSVKGGNTFTLIKITGPLTEEMYVKHVYETVTVTRERPRPRRQ